MNGIAKLNMGAFGKRRRGTPRQLMIAGLKAIATDTRSQWLPQRSDTTTSVDSGSIGGTWTADSAMTLSTLGLGAARTFVSGSTNYLTRPDAAGLSFGNGTTDSPFTLLTLANVTDTAVGRMMISKSNTANREYEFRISGPDALALTLYDESVAASPVRISDATIPQGVWTLFGATYSGGGGATAANGITLYVNGAVVASTPTNSGAYVAMEDLAAPVEIGSGTAHTAFLFDGSMALGAVIGGALSAGQMASMATLCRSYFGVAL